MQIYRASSDGASAGQRNLCFTKACKQWTQHQNRSTHGPYQFIGSFEEFDMRGGDLVSPELWRKDRRSDVLEQSTLRNNVANVRNVMQNNCLWCQQGGGHAWQRRILRPTDRDSAVESAAARNAKLIHDADRLKENRERSRRRVFLGTRLRLTSSVHVSWSIVATA